MSEAERREPNGKGLLTRRLKLRPARDRDGAALAALAAGAAVRQSFGSVLATGTSCSGEAFVVERRSDRAVIGAGAFGAAERDASTLDLALWLGETDWGRGYGTEAAQALIDRAFARIGVSEVCAAIRFVNVRGRRLIEKCGFQPRGTGMARLSLSSGAYPVERFVLSRRAWVSLKAWGAPAEGSDDGPRQTAA